MKSLRFPSRDPDTRDLLRIIKETIVHRIERGVDRQEMNRDMIVVLLIGENEGGVHHERMLPHHEENQPEATLPLLPLEKVEDPYHQTKDHLHRDMVKARLIIRSPCLLPVKRPRLKEDLDDPIIHRRTKDTNPRIY